MKKKQEVEVIVIGEPVPTVADRLLWNTALPKAVFMVPDAKDEPTIQRCIDSAKFLNTGGVIITDLNEITTSKTLKTAKRDLFIAAWGGNFDTQDKVQELQKLLGKQPIYCLGQTHEGHPKHPLYVELTTPLIPFKIAEEKVPN